MVLPICSVVKFTTYLRASPTILKHNVAYLITDLNTHYKFMHIPRIQRAFKTKVTQMQRVLPENTNSQNSAPMWVNRILHISFILICVK